MQLQSSLSRSGSCRGTGQLRSTRRSTVPLRVRAVASPPKLDKKQKKKDAAPASAPAPDKKAAPATIPVPASIPSPFFPGPNDPKWPPERAFAAVALDNLLDSVTDVNRHLKRMGKEKEAADAQANELLVPGDGGRMRLRSKDKPVVLILGSGWGAHSLIKVIDTDTYDVVCVSPRNHFLFTPMLPSTAVGTVEFRSLLEPIRTSNPCITYLEAECDSLDPHTKVAICTSGVAFDDGSKPKFEIQYDVAVVAVGEQPATFGTPGVREHTYFMKEVTDAVELRKRIAEKFELAGLPGVSEEARYSALHFVVVGGGPTGVEFAGTLSDFVREDLRKKYPGLMKYVKVSLLQSGQSILTQFDAKLGQRALEALSTSGVAVRTGVRVTKVTQNQLVLKDGEVIPFGVCVWSTGNAPRPITTSIAQKVPLQADASLAAGNAPNSKLVVDSFMRVVGACDLLALGDCTTVLGNRLPATAQVAGQQGSFLAHLINSGYQIGEGGYRQPPPYKVLRRRVKSKVMQLAAAAAESPEVQWLRTAMMGGEKRIKTRNQVATAIEMQESPPWIRSHIASVSHASGSMDEAVIADDPYANSVPLPPPLKGKMREGEEAVDVRYWERPFEFLSLGIMAYVGNDKALTQVEGPISLKLHGSLAFLLWKSVYITKQVSFRNRVLILFDWMKARVFGRDISLF